MLALEQAFDALPVRYPGPGGAAAVLRDGQVLVQRSWGFADIATGQPFTANTLWPICSITKQFTCALMLDQAGDPDVLDPAVARALPLLTDPPKARHLAHNQSGIRDYFTLAMFCGARAETRFMPPDAQRIISATRSLQFTPGLAYSYSNQNFRILAEAITGHTGHDFGTLLRNRLFDPAGMATATFAPLTATVPGNAVGYEGTIRTGFIAAQTDMHWMGDAGIAASLSDMIAWDRWIDTTRDDPEGLYRRISGPVQFDDGRPAMYGFGLSRRQVLGRAITGHMGGLRGWRSYRMYSPADRVSVIVVFNHVQDARAAGHSLLAALFGLPEDLSDWPVPYAPPSGPYLDSAGQLALTVAATDRGGLLLDAFLSSDMVWPDEHAAMFRPGAMLDQGAAGWRVFRPAENLWSDLAPLTGPPDSGPVGTWHNAELDATFRVVTSGGTPHGAFSGALGQGEWLPLRHHGADVWLYPCHRAIDDDAPGWISLVPARNEHAPVLTIGCHAARKLNFVAVD